MEDKCKNANCFANKIVFFLLLALTLTIIPVNAENTETTVEPVATPDVFKCSEEQESTSSEENTISNSVNSDSNSTQDDVSTASHEIDGTDNFENANINSMTPEPSPTPDVIPSETPSPTEVPDTETDKDSASELHEGWNLQEDKWYYLDSNDQNTCHKGWLYTGGNWYWLDPETGEMRTGWVLDGSNWYWFNNTGYIQTGWLYTGENWYWLDPETGVMATGLRSVEDNQYYFCDSGAMVKNCWANYDDNQMLHFSSSGELDFNGIKTARGIQVTEKNGTLVHGWKYVNGTYYLFSDEGIMCTGWQQVNNDWYFMDNDGHMVTGWLYIDGSWYWLNNSGSMQIGWKFIGGNWYYFNLENGQMLSNGWHYIGKVDYKFSSSGAMVGCWMDVPCYNQFPELPTGCESVALTNLLNYYGFGLTKTTIASLYLPLTSGGNFVTAFSGNPFTGTGGLSGCVAPAIVNAGNNFLWTTGSLLRSRDVSFSSVQSIKERLTNGQPVEVWNTESGGYPGSRYAIQYYNGHSYGLWGGNHAVVIKGYDDEQGIVYS